ncbi:hypothetical protein MAIT1_03470 [Magnetofaba australis IT-1]|uniref:Uncharacterized protein n=1 Tax=Magnetofaba australis IT-1 TaxID=1434232 RepID=A0A1Y2K6X8_9PROT|nr:hypothetical protein MAIT1_03470 [Magnetofaba australis IT-1]
MSGGEGGALRFGVEVSDGGGAKSYEVTMGLQTHKGAPFNAADPVRCIEACFRFLLDREPKESIMSRFDVTVIRRYFPEFDAKLEGYM